MSQKQIEHYIYSTNQPLGEGSTGTVYLGNDTRTGRQVAIKAIDMKNVTNQVTKYLLENQIKSLQISDHPNVLKAIDVIRKPDFCYVITAYLPGKTLHQMIRSRGKIPQTQALSIFKGIVDGYSNLQKNKIIHRDLKPQNIMFTADGIPVICDFGYSEVGGFLAKPKMYYNVGSPSYMAPESITGSVYNQSSEVWSLGTILYQMLQGKPYVPGDKQVMQTIMNIRKNGLVYPTNSSDFSKKLIGQTMKLRPTERISVQNLKAQLLSVSNMNPTQVQNVTLNPTISMPTHQQSLLNANLNIQQNRAFNLDRLNQSYNIEVLNTSIVSPEHLGVRPSSSKGNQQIKINPFFRNSIPGQTIDKNKVPFTTIAPLANQIPIPEVNHALQIQPQPPQRTPFISSVQIPLPQAIQSSINIPSSVAPMGSNTVPNIIPTISPAPQITNKIILQNPSIDTINNQLRTPNMIPIMKNQMIPIINQNSSKNIQVGHLAANKIISPIPNLGTMTNLAPSTSTSIPTPPVVITNKIGSPSSPLINQIVPIRPGFPQVQKISNVTPSFTSFNPTLNNVLLNRGR